MTIKTKEKIKTTLLVLQSIVVLTSVLILLSNVRYCGACGRRYIGFKDACNVCINHKEARINGKYLKTI